MWRFVLLIFFVAGSRQISITEFQVPASVESGEDVFLQCGYALAPGEKWMSIKWWFTPCKRSDDDRIVLYQRLGDQPPRVNPDFDLETKGNDDILLRSVHPDNTGTYRCEVSAVQDEKWQHDKLIVFTKGEMSLNISEVDDGPDDDDEADVLITCEAAGAAPYPDLAIIVNDVVRPRNVSVIDQEDNTYYAWSVALMSRADVDGADVSCELFFTNTNITHDQYKIVQRYTATSTALSTTEQPEDASTTEATPGNRVFGTSACLLLVISALAINLPQ